MNRRPNSCPLSIDDMEAGSEILKAPLGYCPQIDRETRLILRALLDDMFNHLHAFHDPEECDEAWSSAQFMHDILSDILNRTPENAGISDSLEWLKPKTQSKAKERASMSFDEIDEILEPIFNIDRADLHPQALEHLEEQLMLLLHLIKKDRQT